MESGAFENAETEMCLLDSGVQSLKDVPLHPGLQVLNLHCNYIREIENLHMLRSLFHLDLSSNQINSIEGLECLVSLKTLNLSCNNIRVVKSIENLRNLVKLNLSYNQIHNLAGFLLLQGHSYKLMHVELHGNQIVSQEAVVDAFRGCANLKHLMFAKDGAENAVCCSKGYRMNLLKSLPLLQSLDGFDRLGQLIKSDDLSDIPGLEDYMEFLISSTSTSDVNPIALATPRIDAALEKFKHEPVIMSDTTTTSTTDQEHTAPTRLIPREEVNLRGESAERLEKLERQLAELMAKKKSAGSNGDTSSRSEKGTKTTKTKLANKKGAAISDESDDDLIPRKERPSRTPRKKTAGGKTPRKTGNTDKREVDLGPVLSVRQLSPSPPGRRVMTGQEGITAKVEDEKRRDEIQSTYQQLMQELETERERRWKAEEAAKKMADHIRGLQTKAKEETEMQDIAIQASSRLKQALMKSKEMQGRLEEENASLKEDLLDYQQRLEKSKEQEEDQRSTLRTLEGTAAKLETEKIKQHAHESKLTQESQMRCAAISRELELVKNQLKTTKSQLQQLQELLATREHEHRKELSSRYTLESNELQELLRKESARIEERFQCEIRAKDERYNTLLSQYNALEDEFKMALHIEADRFNQVQQAFEQVSEESSLNKQALVAAQRKDEKMTKTITELSALVKEQKGRLSELSRTKHDQIMDQKERIETLEAHLEEARKRMVQMELLKQEKNRLQSQAEAQESVIEGLRSERKLWGQELAQQGASLASDRGRLESKIEGQQHEVNYLKKQLERETDSVRIKSKMIEDQTETIKKLKEAVVDRDNEIKTAREDVLKSQKSLEEQLAEEQAAFQDAQEKIDHLTERKEELKHQLADLHQELEDEREGNRSVNQKWKEKSAMISNLEEQVTQMKEIWENKEARLIEEKEKAVHAATLAIEKLRSMDDAFRKQLDGKEQSHREEVSRLLQEKQQEVDELQHRIVEVEDEMRILLQENQENKRAMENRLRKMGKVFSELQEGMI
ncbi:leucine-rich repeat and coiled-coil domain-containing protein 1-like [Lineus longissimus]|uniref:leucine-rich repeat and coiled-coil domain-containing protein 1-like n=1 Tax=Lineus longissimus TaxID=88925 RepID=UPI00315DB851